MLKMYNIFCLHLPLKLFSFVGRPVPLSVLGDASISKSPSRPNHFLRMAAWQQNIKREVCEQFDMIIHFLNVQTLKNT